MLYGVIWYKCTSWNLITRDKKITCLSINIEGCFWNFVTLTECIVSTPLWLRLYFCIWCHIYLSHSIELHYLRSDSNLLYMYLYVYYLFGHVQICTNDYLIKIIFLYMMSYLPQSFDWTSLFTIWFKPALYVFICVLFIWSCTNLYKWLSY